MTHRLLAAAVLVLACAAPSSAVPFDVIVPSELTLYGDSHVFFGRFSGVIVARDEPIVFNDFNQLGFVDSALRMEAGPDLAWTMELSGSPTGRIGPGEALISEVRGDDRFQQALTTFGPLLRPGETPVDYVETHALLTSIITVGDRPFSEVRVNARWRLQRDDDDMVFFSLVVRAVRGQGAPQAVTVDRIQRVSSVTVPEPAALALLATAGAFAWRRRRTSVA